MISTRLAAAALLLASFALSCGSELGAAGQVQQAAVTENGVGLNGVGLNGVGLNGVGLNGVGLNGASLGGAALQGMRLEETVLSATRADGTVVSGIGMTGATFVGYLSDGSSIPLRIESVQSGPIPNDDLLYYSVSYQRNDNWKPLCDHRELAIPVSGIWDYREGVPGGGSKTSSEELFTFSCRSGAIAKCVEIGYRPWKRVRLCDLLDRCQKLSLAGHHQACTRFIRADYCGDGRAWTIGGRRVNVYDSVGIQADTESWTFEAEWKASGATCLTQQRVLALEAELQKLKVEGGIPACILDLVSPFCGERIHFDTGTLLMNEYETRSVAIDISL